MHNEKIHVLVFPAGSEIASEIFDSLCWQKDIELYGATSVNDHSQMLFRKLAVGLPYFNQSGFIERFNEIIEMWSIDFVYPARDDVQLFLAQHQKMFKAAIVSAPIATTNTCRSKKATYELLSEETFVPTTYESPEKVDSFPVFAKPSIGEGSKGAQLVDSPEMMTMLMAKEQDYVFCEYLPGKAWTVDCFTDAEGKLAVCVPRTRDRVKAGIAVRSTIEQDANIISSIQSIGNSINSYFEFNGAWFFQLKARKDGTPILMEVSPRIPGTMGLTRNLGINYPLLTIYQMAEIQTSISMNSYSIMLDKAFISRYKIEYDYDTVYIDYDDTLTIGNEVNPQALAYLYQCRNSGKQIVLITHHDDEALGELHHDMLARGISETLFTEIVHLNRFERKADYIDRERSIFIDDSFRERSEIARLIGIPTFDVSNIESLLDWRR